MLLESSAIDNKKFSRINPRINTFLKKNRLTLFYLYYFLQTNTKLILLTNYNNLKLRKIASIDKLFKSAS